MYVTQVTAYIGTLEDKKALTHPFFVRVVPFWEKFLKTKERVEPW
jgi:hypothetical protein